MKPNNLENFILSLIFLILYQIISILKIILFNLIIRAPPRISRGKTLPDARDSSRHVMMMRMMMKISRCFVFYKIALFNYTPCLNYILFDMVLVLWFLIASMQNFFGSIKIFIPGVEFISAQDVHVITKEIFRHLNVGDSDVEDSVMLVIL